MTNIFSGRGANLKSNFCLLAAQTVVKEKGRFAEIKACLRTLRLGDKRISYRLSLIKRRAIAKFTDFHVRNAPPRRIADFRL